MMPNASMPGQQKVGLYRRGRPRYAALSGCTNATMLHIASLPGQKILFTFLSVVQYNCPQTKELFIIALPLTICPYFQYLKIANESIANRRLHCFLYLFYRRIRLWILYLP